MQNNPFLEKMQSQPEAKLREIVTTRRADYQPDAIAAAEYVLRERNVSFEVPVEESFTPKESTSAMTRVLKFIAPVVVLYLVGFAAKQTGIKTSYIVIGSIAVLCGIWFFFGIMKGKK